MKLSSVIRETRFLGSGEVPKLSLDNHGGFLAEDWTLGDLIFFEVSSKLLGFADSNLGGLIWGDLASRTLSLGDGA
jgi:hypothetical protein